MIHYRGRKARPRLERVLVATGSASVVMIVATGIACVMGAGGLFVTIFGAAIVVGLVTFLIIQLT